jgi:tetratricopeptide (TPR) repeat protein
MEKAGRTEGAQYGLFLSLLASTHERSGNLQAAFDSLQRVRGWHESLGRSDTINYLASRRAEARILMAWGEYREARTIVDAIGASLRSATGDATLPAWFAATEGALRWRFGDLQGAADIMQAAAQHVRARGAVAMARSVEIPLVPVLVDLERLAEAESLLVQLEAAPDLRIDQQLALATARAQLALKRAEPAAAAEVIDAGLAKIGYPRAKESAALGAALRLGSRAQIVRSDRMRALQMAQAAVAVSEKVARDPAHSADVGEALLILAQAQQMRGPPEDAAATARRAHRALTHGLGGEHRLTREALLAASE